MGGSETGVGKKSERLADHASIHDVARAIGLSRPSLQQLVSDGVLVRVAHGRYDLFDCVSRYCAHLRRQLADARRGDGSDYQSERAKWTAARARISELERAQLEGSLVSVRGVTALLDRVAEIMRSALHGVGHRLAVRLAASREPMQCAALVDDAIGEALATLIGARIEFTGEHEDKTNGEHVAG